MPRISETLPLFLALASLAPPDRTNAFTSSNGGHNKGRIRTGYYRDSKSHGHNDGRRIALDEEVLEGPFVRRHERPAPQEDDEAPPEFNPYLNNLGISHRLPMHQRPLKGGGSTRGLNPTDVVPGGGNSMSRKPAQSQQFHDRTSEVAGYSSKQQQQQQQQPPLGPPQPPKEFTWGNEANLPNTGPPIPPDNSNVNGGGAASSPAFYPNETTGSDQDILDAVAQRFDASAPTEPDPHPFYPDANVNGSQQQSSKNTASPPPPPPATRRPQSDYNQRNPYLGNGANTRASPQTPKNPFNTPSRPNFHGITSAPFSFAKDAGASYWNELSYVEQQREKARLAEEEARRQQAEQEARMIEERRRREEAQRQEAVRLEQEAARLEQEKRKLEQEQKAEGERLRKEAAEIEAEKQRIAESKRIQKEEEERLRRETELEKLRLHKEYQTRLAEEEAKRKRIEKEEEVKRKHIEQEEEERARLVAEIEAQRLQKEQDDRIAAEVARQVADANRIAEAKRKAEEAARQAEEEKRQQEAQERIAAQLAEQERLTEELRRAEEKRKLEEARLVEAERKRVQEDQERTTAQLAEEQKLAEELRVAEEKRKEEEARLVAETQRKRLADEEQAKKEESQQEALRKEEEKARLLQEATRAEARLADEYQKSAEPGSPETDTTIDPRTPANVGSTGIVADKSLTPLEKKYTDTAQSNSKTNESNAADTSESDFVTEKFLSSESELLEEAKLAEATLVAEKRKIEEAKTEYIRKFEQKLAKEAMEAESKLLEEKRQAQKLSEAKSDTTTPVSSGDSVNRGEDMSDESDDNVSGKSLTPLEKKFASGTNKSDNTGSPTRDRPTVAQSAAPQTRSEMEDLEDEKSSFQPIPPMRPPPAFEKSRPVSYSVKTRQATSARVFPKRSPKIADTAVLVKRIQQGDRQGRGKAGILLDANGLTLEERIASTITDAIKDITATKRTYETTRENLRYFKSNTQRRLSRSAREKEKAAEKVADIKARMQEKIREVEEQLEATLSKTQNKIDDEVSRIVDLLVAEIELEVRRQEDMIQLMDSLEELVAAKEGDIAEDKKIANEMIDVRSKLKHGLIAENLDKEVEQKLSLAAIDQELVNDLFGCLIDLQSLFEDAQDRSARTSQSLDDFVRPETRESDPYDWSDIEKMELVFEQAADNVAGAETRIRELSARIDSALVDKVLVLGEDVPPGMAKLARKAAARGSIKKAITSADIDMDEIDLEGVMELQGKNEKELLSMLGKSVGSATVDGSKAAAFSLKSMLDSMTGKSVGDAAGQNGNELKEDKEDSNAIVSSGDSEGKGSKTSDALHSDSSEAANEALKETTKGLLDSLKAAAALSVKMFRGQ